MLGFAYPDAVAMAPLCRSAGIPYSIFVLGSDFRVRVQQPRFRDMVLKCLGEAPLIFCPGEALRRDMIAAGVPGDRIQVFANGIDHTRFCLPLPATPRQDVLFVGNLVAVKGVDRLLRAWAIVQREWPDGGGQRPTLQLVGDGQLRSRLEALARNLGLTDAVQFCGRVAHDAIAGLMQVSRALCLSSHSEGMPNVVLEALACGTPVVATAVGEVPFLVTDNVNGRVVANDESAPAGLAQALLATLTQTWDPLAIADTVRDLTWQGAARTVVERIARDGLVARTGGKC